MGKIKRYTLEIAVFICGAIVMIFEILGSRVLGPYFGTSTFIWTSLIGVILGGLSLGYYFGGKMADKKSNTKTLSMIVFISGCFIGLTAICKTLLLLFLKVTALDIQVSSIMASLVLFLPTSITLGMVSPYAAKLRLNDLNASGATIGNLYAISAIGSVFGTFLSGFYLIPYLGTTKLLMFLSLTLIILSLLLFTKKKIIIRGLTFCFILSCWFVTNFIRSTSEEVGNIDIDTEYNRILIGNHKDPKTNKWIKSMTIGDLTHSSMFLNNSRKLVHDITKFYHLAHHFNPHFKKVLMLGGGGYSYPKNFLVKYPKATIDVVEIDAMVTELAKKHFKLKKHPRLTIHHQDGRVYLNRTEKKYDVIIGDSFNSMNYTPYQLTTKETIQRQYDILNDEGTVILNICSSINGELGRFLRAEYHTYKSIFPQVYLFPVDDSNDGDIIQNVVLIALKSDKKYAFNNTNLELNRYLKHLWKNKVPEDMPLLTDDFAPVNYYSNIKSLYELPTGI